MAKTTHAFRLIVLRRPVQQDLFTAEAPRQRYTLIATNRAGNPAEIVWWYNQRGETSENRIKELKIGFGMERLPCGTFAANAVFFRIGVLAYNLFVLFKLLALPQAWSRCQVPHSALATLSGGGQSGPACRRGDSQSSAMAVGLV